MEGICKGCKYYNVCGQPKRVQPCNGKKLRADIQRFGGRGASSGETRPLSKKAKTIIKNWEKTKKATRESEEEFRKEVNKMTYNQILKIAETIDNAQLNQTTTGGAFAISVALDNVIEVGKKKNANKWSIDFGKWRER